MSVYEIPKISPSKNQSHHPRPTSLEREFFSMTQVVKPLSHLLGPSCDVQNLVVR